MTWRKRLKKPRLYFCPDCEEKELTSCIKGLRRQPGRKCTPKGCDDFESCRIREKFPTYNAFLHSPEGAPSANFAVEWGRCGKKQRRS